MNTDVDPTSPKLERVDPLGTQAYRAIREQIATGSLAPGESLTERSLAMRLGVSPTPIREALRRLEDEGLVERQDRRKTIVVSHSAEALRQFVFIEISLRSTQARFAAANITDAIADELEAVLDALELGQAANAPSTQLDLAREFDVAIARAADNAVLNRMIETVAIFGRETKLRSVHSMQRLAEHGVARTRLEEHRAILGALRARDAEQAEQTMRTHLVAAMDYLMNQANSHNKDA